jgi:fructose-1,6-bisphosphatase-3
VQLEKGESPLKRCGKAITIDGAFSEAYGDHGFTLLIEPHGTSLAMHHHFESVEAAISTGSDIIPTVTSVRMWDVPKRIADSQRGAELRQIAGTLEKLVAAYQANAFPQRVRVSE